MKIAFFLILLKSCLFATVSRHELEVEGSQLIYYLESPDKMGQYPIMLTIEGSYVEEIGPQSVLGLHKKLAPSFLDNGIGMITMERRGVDGESINANLFHYFNTPSQRLCDHIHLIHHLSTHPPHDWNGLLYILGGSEGGPIAIKLAYAFNPSACIVLVGCGDQSFKEYIWNTLQLINSHYTERESTSYNPYNELPCNRESYEAQVEMMKSNPDPTLFWFGQSYLYWADAIDQTEYREFLGLNCPIFVVTGSEDIECASTDRLIELARKNNKDVAYFRVEGMGHHVLDPQWMVMDRILKWVSNCSRQIGVEKSSNLAHPSKMELYHAP